MKELLAPRELHWLGFVEPKAIAATFACPMTRRQWVITPSYLHSDLHRKSISYWNDSVRRWKRCDQSPLWTRTTTATWRSKGLAMILVASLPINLRTWPTLSTFQREEIRLIPDRAHLATTGPEFFEQVDGRLDVLILGAGTGRKTMQYLDEGTSSTRWHAGWL